VKHQHRAGLAGGGIDADTVGSVGPVDTVGGGLIHKARHRLVVESPERIRRGQLVVTGVEHIRPVALPNEKQRPVDRHHRIEKHGDIHFPRLGHAVVTRPSALILMPLPHIAFGGRLGLELELMNIDIFAEPLRSGSTRRGCRASRLNT
jgi:hypothetical protein